MKCVAAGGNEAMPDKICVVKICICFCVCICICIFASLLRKGLYLYLHLCAYLCFMKCVVAGGNEAMPDKINISPTDFLSPQKLDDNDCYFKQIAS